MKRLELHVESIVGPIRASERRKDRIREELLAHLRSAEEEGGTDAAIARFGSPEAVRAEIQAAVPALERWLWSPVRVLGPVDGLFLHSEHAEGPMAFALRGSALVTVLCAVIVGITLVALSVLEPGPGSARHTSPLGPTLRILAALALSTGATFYVLEKSGLRARLDLRHLCSPGTFSACLVATILGWGTLFLAAAHVALRDGRSPGVSAPVLDWVASWSFAGALESLGILALAFAFLTWEARQTKRRFARWGAPITPE